MATHSKAVSAERGPGADPLVLFAVWVGTCLAGLITTAVAWFGWIRLDYPRWPEKSTFDFPIGIASIGILAAVAVATLVTLRVRRRGPGRARNLWWWALGWAVALPVAAVGLWQYADYRDRANHDWVAADVVGTWEVRGPSDVEPKQIKTLHADGTYESKWVSGPANERTTYRGTYLISANGRLIEFRDHNSIQGTGEPVSWEWNIGFTDRDHFRVWSRSWKYTATDLYARKQ